ncbi:MAG: MFS transporter [Acidobacteriales bacterium]|nr:MFS transporter [Terriglobales bacterium]
MTSEPVRKWATVALLSVGMIIAYVDRANLSVVLTVSDFKSFFLLNDTDRGLLNSVFFWTYALLQIPAGWVVDRFGVRRPYAIGFLLWCLVSAATGMVQTFWMLVAARLVLGVGEAIVSPASLRWIGLHCHEKERGLAIGVYMAGTKIGPAIGAPLTAMLVTALDWRAMFVVLGLGGLVWLGFWLWLVEDDHAESKAGAKERRVSVLPLFRTPLLWGILVGTFCYNFFVFFCMTWLPAYLVERRGLSLNSMGLYTMMSFGGMAVMAALAGWAADVVIRKGRDAVNVRKAFTIAGLVLASTEVIGAHAASREVALFFAIFSLVGLGLATANYWALTQSLVPRAALGRIAGVQNCASNLSGIAAALATGWLKQITGSYEAPMRVVWLLLVLGVACYVFVVRRKYAVAVQTLSGTT